MKKITLYEYKLLSDNEQFNLLFQSGQFLDYHLEKDKRFALYAIDLFFVEIEYDVNDNRIVDKRSFITGSKLDRYSNLKI